MSKLAIFIVVLVVVGLACCIISFIRDLRG